MFNLKKRYLKILVLACFLANSLSHYAYGGIMSSASLVQPPILKYLSINTANPYNYFNFLLDKGDGLSTHKLNSQANKLINYFFLGLTLPKETFWVNLKPNQPDKLTSPELSKTDLGKVLLEQDLLLKKDTAKYLHPRNRIGKQFWQKLYRAIGKEQVKKAKITTSNRVWIVPDKATIVETETGALVAEAKLKVLLENEYLKNKPNDKIQQLSEKLMKELIIPEIIHDVNNSPKYAPLRQIYHSLILAQYYKTKYSNPVQESGPYSKIIDKSNITGLASQYPWSKDKIWQQYFKSYKNGEYKLKHKFSGINRMYFSGGIIMSINPYIISKDASPALRNVYMPSVSSPMTIAKLDTQSSKDNFYGRINVVAGKQYDFDLVKAVQSSPLGKPVSHGQRIEESKIFQLTITEPSIETHGLSFLYAQDIFNLMLQSPNGFESGLNNVRDYLESRDVDWHVIRMVWGVLRNYRVADRLEERVSDYRNEVLNELTRVILLDTLLAVYMDMISMKEDTQVSMNDLQNNFSGFASREEFLRIVEWLKENSFLNVKNNEMISFDFDRLVDEEIKMIGINISDSSRAFYFSRHEHNLDYTPLKAYKEAREEGLHSGNMKTYFGRSDGTTSDYVYKTIRNYLSNLPKNLNKAINIIVIGASYGIQGYDVAMACGDAKDKGEVNVPINLVISDAQHGSLDHAKRGGPYNLLEIDELNPRTDFEPALAHHKKARRRKKFFQKSKDARALDILSAKEFEKRWGIKLRFEKVDILNGEDIARVLEYGEYDLVVATNVHYDNPFGENDDMKAVEIKYHSHIVEFLHKDGVFMRFSKGGLISRDVVYDFSRILDKYFQSIPYSMDSDIYNLLSDYRDLYKQVGFLKDITTLQEKLPKYLKDTEKEFGLIMYRTFSLLTSWSSLINESIKASILKIVFDRNGIVDKKSVSSDKAMMLTQNSLKAITPILDVLSRGGKDKIKEQFRQVGVEIESLSSSLETNSSTLVVEKPEIAGSPLETGGIDLANIELLLEDEERIKAFSPVGLRVLCAAKYLEKGWDSLSLLYVHEVMGLIKDKIITEFREYRNVFVEALGRLKEKQALDSQAAEFYQMLMSNQPISAIRIALVY